MKKNYILLLITSLFWSFSAMSQSRGTYCESKSGGSSNEFVYSVNINDQVLNTSSYGKYHDYTSDESLIANLQAGTAVPVEVINGKFWIGDQAVIWVDWNQNNIFESSEKQDLVQAESTVSIDILIGGEMTSCNSMTFSGDLAIPSNALPGTTRMRIIVNGDKNNVEACGDYGYGETEDYTVNILPDGIVPNFEVGTNIVKLNEEVVFTNASLGEGITSYEWNFGEGANPATVSGVGPHTVTYSSLGTKIVSLTISDGGEPKTFTNNAAVTVAATNPALGQVQSLSAEVDHNVVNVEWLSPTESYFANPEGFEGEGFPPRGWTSRQSDALDAEIRDLQGSQIRWSYNTHENNVHSGNGAVRIESNRPIYNWLTSPEVKVHEDQQLSFWLKMRNLTVFHCQLNIMIKDGDADWVRLTTIEDTDYAEEEYLEQVVDLAAYANKTVQIAFVHHQHERAGTVADTQTKMALDDISIVNKPGNTSNPEAGDEPTGYKIYVDNVELTTVGADIRSYLVKNLEKGTHTVSVVAVYGQEESLPSTIDGLNTIDPEVSFVASSNRLGLNEELTFTAQIQGSATSVVWSLGEGADFDTSEGVEISGVYTTIGKKTVSVTLNGTVVNEKVDFVDVIFGDANVQEVRNVALSREQNNVTISWSSLLNDYRLYEDFESNSFTKNNWTLKKSETLTGELSEDGSNWFVLSENSFKNKGAKYIKTGKYSAGIGYTAPQFSWLITPELELGDNDVLKFWMWYENGLADGKNYYTNFRVMAKGSTDTDWTQILDYTADDVNATNEMETEVEADLSAFSNKTIQIAFVYEFTDGFSMGIDDVRVMTAEENSTATDFSKLNIYRDNVKVHEVTDGALTDWTDVNLDTKIYTYNVSYVNGSGVEGQPSRDKKVGVYKPDVLPYSQDFEGDVDWIFYDESTAFKLGTTADFVKTNYSIPAREGKFVATNTSDVANGVKAWDRLSLPPLNLGQYGGASLKLDYVSDGMQYFCIKGRETQASPWVDVHYFEASSEWTSSEVELPLFVLKDGYQLSIMFDNSKKTSNGVAFDNVQVVPHLGKHLAVEYAGAEVQEGGSQYLGIVKPGTSHDFIVTLRNVGSEPIEVSSVSITGDNFSIGSEATNQTIAVQEVLEVEVRYTAVEETAAPEIGQLVINSDAVESPYTVNVTAEGGLAEWTYMTYIYEDNTYGGDLYGLPDMNEWEVNGSIPGVVNYLVLYDGRNDSKDGLYYIEKDPAGNNNVLVSRKIETAFTGELDMDDPQTLENFMIWCKENYPAKRYGCNVWDHGTGIFKSEKVNDWKYAVGHMTLWELTKAVKAFVEVDGQGFDIFGFDVCLLGQVETVYALKDYTKVVIASEENEPGDGWDYDTQFTRLNANPEIDTYEFAKQIVIAYDESYDGGSQGNTESTQVAVRTDLFQTNFIPALNGFADAAMREMTTIKDKVKTAFNNALFKDANNCREHRDLGGFLANLEGQADLPVTVTESIDALQLAYDECIVEFRRNDFSDPVATGLKIWIANDITNNTNAEYYLDGENYLTFAETKWDEFLYYYAHPAVFGTPRADFEIVGSLTGRKNMVVSLFDNSPGVAPSLNQRLWSFEPNTVEILEGDIASDNLVVKFLEAGKYTVSLSLSNDLGTDSQVKENVVSVRDISFPAPADLGSSVTNNQVTLSWHAPVSQSAEETMGTDKLFESFENDWLPEGWMNKNSETLAGELSDPTAAGNRQKWFKCSPTSFGTQNTDYVKSGKFAAGLNYDSPGFNWLITPEINVDIYDCLNFSIWFKQDTEYHANFRVMVLADGIWNEELFYTEGDNVNLHNEIVSVSLADYVGKSVKVAFVYEYTNGYQLAIDDISVVRKAPAGATDGVVVNYQVFRNGNKVGETTELTFTDEELENGNYTYTVKAVYANIAGISEASSVEQVALISTGLENGSKLVARVYPNPNQGNFTLAAEDCIGGQWYLYNSVGELVKSGNIDNERNSIRVNSNGVYMLLIKSEDVNEAIKVVVN